VRCANRRGWIQLRDAAAVQFCLLPIMISQLRNTNFVADLSVNDPMLSRNTTRPVTLECVSERLGFTNSAIGIAHDLFDKQINAPQRVWIRSLPVEIFFPRLRRKDEVHVSSLGFFRMPLPRSSESIDFNRRFAFAGDRSRYAVSCSDSYSANDIITTA
jgi:hypothetical protein